MHVECIRLRYMYTQHVWVECWVDDGCISITKWHCASKWDPSLWPLELALCGRGVMSFAPSTTKSRTLDVIVTFTFLITRFQSKELVCLSTTFWTVFRHVFLALPFCHKEHVFPIYDQVMFWGLRCSRPMCDEAWRMGGSRRLMWQRILAISSWSIKLEQTSGQAKNFQKTNLILRIGLSWVPSS